MGQAFHQITGRCFCGQLSYEARPPMLWSALCHCTDCRRAAGADYVAWFGVERDGLVWTGRQRRHASSPGVFRSFCPDCGSPMAFESARFPDETHLMAPSLDDPRLYRPEAHVWWQQRVPWFTETTDLPRHDCGLDT